MSEYEIIELLQQRYSELGQLSAHFFTLVTAYVAVAYIVGAKLSRDQLYIVTFLYLIWAVGTSTAVWNATQTSAFYLSSLREMNSTFPDEGYGVTTTYAYLILGHGGSILASLYFMRAIRKRALIK